MPDPRVGLDLAPWPNLTAKRCLVLDPSGFVCADDLRRRGAHEVVVGRLDQDHGQLFDVVVGVEVLVRHADPTEAVRRVRNMTDGLFLSVEPIDLTHTILSRGRAWYDGLGAVEWRGNGSGLWQILQTGGFRPERNTKPFGMAGGSPYRGTFEGLLTGLLTRSPHPPYRGTLARAVG